MRQDFRDERAEQASGEYARQDAAEQLEIAEQDFGDAVNATTLTATSTAMKIIDQPIGLRFLRGASLSIGSSTGSLGSSAK